MSKLLFMSVLVFMAEPFSGAVDDADDAGKDGNDPCAMLKGCVDSLEAGEVEH